MGNVYYQYVTVSFIIPLFLIKLYIFIFNIFRVKCTTMVAPNSQQILTISTPTLPAVLLSVSHHKDLIPIATLLSNPSIIAVRYVLCLRREMVQYDLVTLPNIQTTSEVLVIRSCWCHFAYSVCRHLIKLDQKKNVNIWGFLFTEDFMTKKHQSNCNNAFVCNTVK